jgi:hypothetical protein
MLYGGAAARAASNSPVSVNGSIAFKNTEVLFHTSARLLGVSVGPGGTFLTYTLNTDIDF